MYLAPLNRAHGMGKTVNCMLCLLYYSYSFLKATTGPTFQLSLLRSARGRIWTRVEGLPSQQLLSQPSCCACLINTISGRGSLSRKRAEYVAAESHQDDLGERRGLWEMGVPGRSRCEQGTLPTRSPGFSLVLGTAFSPGAGPGPCWGAGKGDSGK